MAGVVGHVAFVAHVVEVRLGDGYTEIDDGWVVSHVTRWFGGKRWRFILIGCGCRVVVAL